MGIRRCIPHEAYMSQDASRRCGSDDSEATECLCWVTRIRKFGIFYLLVLAIDRGRVNNVTGSVLKSAPVQPGSTVALYER
jgi:hypothetical protein